MKVKEIVEEYLRRNINTPRCEVRVEMLRKTNTIHGAALITKSKLYGYCACRNEVLAHTKYCNNCGTLLNWNTK